jgi:hypothetical protein
MTNKQAPNGRQTPTRAITSTKAKRRVLTSDSVSMSSEEESTLFQSGMDALLHAKANANSPDYDDLLIEATQQIERAVDIIEEGDASYNLYAQFSASAHARCLLLVDRSVDIDTCLSSSPLFEVLLDSRPRGPGDQFEDLEIDERVLNSLWEQLDEIRDQRSCAARPELFSPRCFANYIASFNRAISCSSGSTYLELLWNACRAVGLYLRMEQYNPDDVALCIASMRRAIQLEETMDSKPSHTDAILLQTLPELPYSIPLFKKRLSWLKYLVSVYTKR